MNPVSNSVKNFGEDAVIIGPKNETYFSIYQLINLGAGLPGCCGIINKVWSPLREQGWHS